MKKLLVALIVTLILTPFGELQAQENNVLNGIYEKKHIPKRVTIPFQYLREADVMWSKTIWRKIDLREKINLPIYYPEFPMDDRMSLIDLLVYGVENGEIKAYDPSDAYNEFKAEMTLAEVKERMGGGNDTTVVIDDETGDSKTVVSEGEIISSEVKEYLVKELWFFDKQRSVLEVRLIGMCPIRYYYKDEDEDQTDVKRKKLFWVYYPDIRPLIARHEVFNPFNDAERRSFDDIIVKRYFSSYIVQESNTYNNRLIENYTIGMETMLEAERIKNQIFNLEQDLWEY